MSLNGDDAPCTFLGLFLNVTFAFVTVKVHAPVVASVVPLMGGIVRFSASSTTCGPSGSSMSLLHEGNAARAARAEGGRMRLVWLMRASAYPILTIFGVMKIRSSRFSFEMFRVLNSQ